MIAFLRRSLRSLFAPHPRVVALREQAAAALSYANHVAMMRRCVDELFREARTQRTFSAIEGYRTQKAELETMEATQARQEERFAQNKADLVRDGFDVGGIVLSPPDIGRAEYEADQLIASFELESELGSPTLH